MTADTNGKLRSKAEKIVGKSRVLDKPFLLDYVRQLVSEVLSGAAGK